MIKERRMISSMMGMETVAFRTIFFIVISPVNNRGGQTNHDPKNLPENNTTEF